MSLQNKLWGGLRCVLAVALCTGSPVYAQEAGSPEVEKTPAETAKETAKETAEKPKKAKKTVERSDDQPFYRGEHLRYQNADIFQRTGASLLGNVLEIGNWDQDDWLIAGGTAATTIALMAPTDPSPDVRLQVWVQDNRSRAMNKVMPPLRTPAFRTYGLGTIGLLAIYGHVGKKPKVLEAISLSMEAVTVAVTLHLAQKLLIGREGPTDGDGLGIIHGPTEGIHLYPAGTPSGHTASTWAMSVVLMDQVDTWWGDVLGWSINSYVAVSLIYNDQHYVSDIIWGAPLGYFVGKWVSKHRSSKYTYRNGVPVQVSLEKKKVRFATISPLPRDQYGTRGMAAVWVF